MSITDVTAGDADFYRSLAEHAGLPFVRLGIDEAAAGGDPVRPVDPAAGRMLSEAVCRHFGVVALSRGERTLTVATSSVADDLGLQAAGALTGLEVRAVIAPKGDIIRTLNGIFGQQAAPAAPASAAGGGAEPHSYDDPAAETFEAGHGLAPGGRPTLRIGE